MERCIDILEKLKNKSLWKFKRKDLRIGFSSKKHSRNKVRTNLRKRRVKYSTKFRRRVKLIRSSLVCPKPQSLLPRLCSMANASFSQMSMVVLSSDYKPTSKRLLRLNSAFRTPKR